MMSTFSKEVVEVLNKFDLKGNDYEIIMSIFDKELTKGLREEHHDNSSIGVLPSYVTKLPTGKESGQFLALDFGGANYQIILVTLNQNQKQRNEAMTYVIPREIMTGRGEDLFDFIANSLENFVQLYEIKEPMRLILTFAFPCVQNSLQNAVLLRWTKGFSASNCEGRNVAELLQNAINKINLKIKCVAVINDAVCTLASVAMVDPKAAIGCIVGNGTNVSYLEDRNGSEIMNVEWGSFGDNGVLDNFRTEYDRKLDLHSNHPGQQIFEKMCSALYIGELVRIVLLDLIDKQLIFRGIVPEALKVPMSFRTKYIAEVENDLPHLFHSTLYMLNENFNIFVIDDVDVQIVRAICEKVAKRSAYLIGTGLACLLKRISKEEVTIGTDGSLFKFHKQFSERITECIRSLVGDNVKFNLRLSEDGSTKGSAAIAATLDVD